MPILSPTTDPVAGEPPRIRALAILRRWLNEGGLQPGDPIPTERELSKMFGLSLATLHRATKALEVEGRLRVLGGRTRVVAEPAQGQAKLLRNTIAVFAPSRKPQPNHRMPGWSDYVSVGAFDAIESCGYHGLAFHSERQTSEDLEALIAARPLGAIIPELASQQTPPRVLIEQLRSAGIGLTVLGNAPEMHDCDRIISDHTAGAAEVTAWMIAKGCRRILQMLPMSDAYWIQMRREGYEHAMRTAGLELRPALHAVRVEPFTKYDPLVGSQAVFEAQAAYNVGCLLPYLNADPKIDAILLPSDGEVPAMAAAIRQLGRKPNVDILLGGYDNYWSDIWERKFESIGPAVSIDRNNPGLGQELVKLLIDRTEGRLPAEPVCRRVKPQLVELAASN